MTDGTLIVIKNIIGTLSNICGKFTTGKMLIRPSF
jgi:hypothetical protein